MKRMILVCAVAYLVIFGLPPSASSSGTLGPSADSATAKSWVPCLMSMVQESSTPQSGWKVEAFDGKGRRATRESLRLKFLPAPTAFTFKRMGFASSKAPISR